MKTQLNILEVAQRHYDAENLLKSGEYGFNDDGSWKGQGCSIGCFACDAGYKNEGEIHAFVAEKYGYPEWAVRLQDTIFEGLPEDNRKEWHLNFSKAVSGVTDWQSTLHKIHCAILDCALETAGPVKSVVLMVRKLHEDQCTDGEKWSAARSAARSAGNAESARSAAYTSMSISILSAMEPSDD